MKTATATLAVAAALAVSQIDARPTFIALIPNGANVPGVNGLGHVSTAGGGPLNDFGKAFMGAKTKWTTELCNADSDGDGQTNGQELGDPCCAWVAASNEKVLWTTGVSHPGDATKKSDPTLWASVSCTAGPGTVSANSNSTVSGTKAPSNTTGASTTAPTSSAPTSSAPTSRAPTSSTPAPTPTSAAVSYSSVAVASVAAVTALAALFA